MMGVIIPMERLRERMKKKEYIEREAAIAVIYGQHVGGKEACENARPNTYGADLREIVADIEDLPAADVRPVEKATWETVTEQPYFRKHYHVVACSACQKRGNQGWNFCPNCGADMREER